MNDGVQVIVPREVPLGGPRSMTVRRTLPARERSFVGAWCFVDHYGPDDVSATGGMDVAPHPHCGLATVSWLFSGEVEHRDSLGTVALVRPGEVNLMTAGRGISHSEVSTPGTSVLHGAQLWVVLPSAVGRGRAALRAPRAAGARRSASGVSAQVFVGSLWGSSSPVRRRDAAGGSRGGAGSGRRRWSCPLPEGFEVAVLVDRGVGDVRWGRGRAGRARAWSGGAASGRGACSRRAASGARVLVLGGEPFGEEVVMWWNFIGRSHDDVVGGPRGLGGRAGAVRDGARLRRPGRPDPRAGAARACG